MLKERANGNQLIDWAVAGRSFDGHSESGDQYLVKFFEDGVLLAVVDGLGHGDRAAVVAKAAVATLREQPAETVIALTQRCHKVLRGTRGVVMSLASLRRQKGDAGGMMTWLGVGNVTGVLLRSNGKPRDIEQRERENLLLRGGILGYQLPAPRASDLAISQGDTLVLATDGLRSAFSQDLTLDVSPQELADHLFAIHGRGTDDALVLVVRYLGGASGVVPGEAALTGFPYLSPEAN